MNRKNSKLGLRSGTVRLESPNALWAELFNMEKLLLQTSMKNEPILIEHIGSTSISSIKAKPIIDILLVITNIYSLENIIVKIIETGYEKCSHHPRNEILFKKGNDDSSTHYLHLLEEDKDWQRYILFRDFLRSNILEAKRYESLKLELAKKYKNDRRVYTSLKEAYVEAILKQLR